MRVKFYILNFKYKGKSVDRGNIPSNSYKFKDYKKRYSDGDSRKACVAVAFFVDINIFVFIRGPPGQVKKFIWLGVFFVWTAVLKEEDIRIILIN